MAVDLERLRNLAETARAKSQQSRQRKDGRSWYRISNQASGTAEVYLFDMIGEWGVTAQDFVGELKAITAPAIDLHLNCEGGEVFDGLAIYESLRQHPASVTAYVDGLAASAASFIVQAADRRVMARNARLMIHDAHGLVIGNAADMREMATLLDDLSDNIADIYAERAGGTVAKWRKAMSGPNGASDGTWYSAQDAVDAGLADEVAGKPDPEPENTVQAPGLAWDPNQLLDTLRGAFGKEGVA
jgi:ATP-dependent protease ClpP protease subunit